MQEVKTTSSDNIGLSFIRTDGGTQARAGLNEATVIEYLDAMREGVEFPPVVLFYDGTDYWLADGFHRVEARRRFKEEGRGSIIAADVRQGTRRDAVLYAAGANDDHGLRRSADDKRRAVLCLLEDKEWGAWADRAIARQCRVSPTFVGKVRAEAGLTVHVDSEESQERTYTTRHGTEAVMKTSNIGTAPRNLADGIKANVSDSAYESIYSLQNAVLAYYSPYPQHDVITLLENLKADRRDPSWSSLSLHLGRNGKIFRVSDLRQAVNNALDSMRFMASQTTVSQPSEPAQEKSAIQKSAEEINALMAFSLPATYRISSEMLAHFGENICAGDLVHNRASSIVEYNNSEWVCTGGAGRGHEWDYVSAIRAVTPDLFDGTTVDYDIICDRGIRGGWFYHGQSVKCRGKTYVLVGPGAKFAPDEEQPAPEPVAAAVLNSEQTEPRKTYGPCANCGRELTGPGWTSETGQVCDLCAREHARAFQEPAQKPRIAPFVMGHFQVANEALARIYTAIPKSRQDDIHDFAALIATLERLERRIGSEYDMS